MDIKHPSNSVNKRLSSNKRTYVTAKLWRPGLISLTNRRKELVNQLEKEMDGIIMIMMQALICPGKHEELNITVNTIQHIL